MYRIYVVLHFVLMLVWIFAALALNYKFLRKFRRGSPKELSRLFQDIQSVSDKTEMPASFFLPLLGVLMIVVQTHWLTVGFMHLKIVLALIAIGLYHMSRSTARNAVEEISRGGSGSRLAKRYILLRSTMILLLVIVVGLLLWYKRGFSTLHIISSFLNF